MDKKNIEPLLVAFIIGISLGFISLVIATLTVPLVLFENFYFSLFVEETLKLLGIFLLLKIYKKHLSFFFLALITGLGFGLFELWLVSLSQKVFFLPAITLLAIHTLSSLFNGLAVNAYLQKRKSFLIFIFFIIALLVHACYNNIVIKNI